MSKKQFGYIGAAPTQSVGNLSPRYLYQASKASGGIVNSDKVFITHTFVANGNFVASANVSPYEAQIYVIGGGGGGGGAENANNSS